MSYSPISGLVPQLSRNAGGAAASGYYLKGYAAGTSTPLSMGIDSTPTSTLVKCRLNSTGYPISNDSDETTIFIPHFNASYKLVLYTNSTDADANTTANAVWVVDNITGVFDASAITYTATATVTQRLNNIDVATYVALRGITSTQLEDGDTINVTNDGVAGQFVVKTGTVTDNGGTLIVFTDDSNRYAERPFVGLPYVDWFGAVGDGATVDTAAFQAGMLVAQALGQAANFDAIPLAGTPGKNYFIDGTVETGGAGFTGVAGLGCKITMDPAGDFILFDSEDEVFYEHFNVDGGWDGNRGNPANGFPVIRHRKEVAAVVTFTGQVHMKDVWVTLSKDDAFDLSAFGYSTFHNLTGRGLRQNGMTLYGGESNAATVTSTTLYNCNMASCEYSFNTDDLFAVAFVGCVWEACRGVFIEGTNNRAISFSGCYSETIETGFSTINFSGSASGLGLSIVGNFLAYLPNGTASTLSTNFRSVFVAANAGDFTAAVFQDDEALVINRENSNGNQIDIQRDTVSQMTVRCEGGGSTLQQQVDGGTLSLNTRNASSVAFGMELTEDAGARYFRPNTDNSLRVGSAARRPVEYFAILGTINTSDAREKTIPRTFTQAEIEAAKELSRNVVLYQWLSSVEEKGEAAREHVGMTVQSAIAVLESHNLDPFNYGFICHDEWSDIIEDNVIATPAGDRYSFRLDQLSMFMLAGLNARLEGAGI